MHSLKQFVHRMWGDVIWNFHQSVKKKLEILETILSNCRLIDIYFRWHKTQAYLHFLMERASLMVLEAVDFLISISTRMLQAVTKCVARQIADKLAKLIWMETFKQRNCRISFVWGRIRLWTIWTHHMLEKLKPFDSKKHSMLSLMYLWCFYKMIAEY